MQLFQWNWFLLEVVKFQGGSVVRIFHKDLEAFLVAEGVFGSQPTENGNKPTHKTNILFKLITQSQFYFVQNLNIEMKQM